MIIFLYLVLTNHSLQCCDTVGWVTGRASSLLKVGCWFVDGGHFTGDVRCARLGAPVVTTISIILSSNKIQTARHTDTG